jgi:hypothetical protein
LFVLCIFVVNEPVRWRGSLVSPNSGPEQSLATVSDLVGI